MDIAPQPNYPFEFIQANAFDYILRHGHEFDAIHASPPCRDHTPLTSVAGVDGSAWMLPATRYLLNRIGKPYVIENVPGSPMRKDIVLCGSMFGLRVYRHRWFESNVKITAPVTDCRPLHTVKTATKRRREAWDAGMNVSITGDVGTYLGPEAMGIDWMTGNELSQAIPPAYTKHIGEQLIEMLRV